MLEPGRVREAVENWDEVAPALLERARCAAVGGVMDLTTAELVQRLRTGNDAAVFAAAPRSIAPMIPIIDVQFTYGDTTLRWFSVISTIGTPVDVTAQELRIESFFPSDDDTVARWALITTVPTLPPEGHQPHDPRVVAGRRERLLGASTDHHGRSVRACRRQCP